MNGSRLSLPVSVMVTVAAWLYTIREASSMSVTMPMPGGWAMSMVWMGMGRSALAEAALFLIMWTVMMIAMMLPSVMPAVLLHQRLIAARVARGEAARGSHALLLAGYFGVWALFGLAAYVSGTALARAAMASERVSSLVPAATGGALVLAGVYQLTRWKQACLHHCRSPLDFFASHEIRGARDSWKFGLHHGAYCTACCWGLMLMQLVLGVMSLPLMATVATLILLEKQWRHGPALARAAGMASIAGGAWLVLRATIRT